MFAVFANDKPATLPSSKYFKWRNSTFETLKEAQGYAMAWLGEYSPIGFLELNVEFYYNGEDFVVIREVV